MDMGRVAANCGGQITAMLSLAEEDVNAHSNWIGGRELQSEVRDGLTLYGILLVVQGGDNLGHPPLPRCPDQVV